MGNWSAQLALPGHAWLPLGLAGLVPLLLVAIIVVSRRRRRGIATVLALRTVLLLGFGFATLAVVATVAVVHTGLDELRERHIPGVRGLADVLERSPLGTVGGDALLRLALFRAKDPSVGFVAAGTDGCRSSCLLSAPEQIIDLGELKARLIDNWPVHSADEHVISIGGRPYLLIANPTPVVGGVRRVTIVVGIDAEYLAQQATRTAWILLTISYVLLVIVGWSSWQQVSRSLSTRIDSITTQLRSGSVDEASKRLEVDGHELRELADSVAEYIKRNVDQQRSSDERYRRLVEISPDAVLICSETGIQFANSAAIALAGARNRYEMMGLPINRFLEFEEVRRSPSDPASALRPARWKRTDGTVLHVEVAEVADSAGDVVVRQYLVRDITHRRLREDALAHRAEHDSLTGLVNRARFEARLKELLEQDMASIDPAGVRDIAVLFIDLDGFKPVNDQYGHAAGDAVLVAVAARLRESTRGTDLVARLGGDEFAVLLEVRDPVEVTTVAQRILSSLHRPILVEGARIVIGASLGTASTRPGGREASGPAPFDSAIAAAELIRAADAAMYVAKTGGGDRFVTASGPPQSPEEASDVSFYATA